MLKPAPMVKVNLTGLKDQLEQTVERLERLGLVHVLTPGELESGFETGRPLSYGPKVSELLVKVRGLAKVLQLEAGEPTIVYPAHELGPSLEEELAAIEAPVVKLHEKHNSTTKALEESRSRAEKLEPFQSLELKLELLQGYDSLVIEAGQLSPEGLADFEAAHPGVEHLVSGELVLFFLPETLAEPAGQLLAQLGFRNVELPEGEGKPSHLLAQLEREVAELERELSALEAEREALATRHGPWLAAAEELLAIEAAKSELPLRLTTSAHTFLLSGWVPERQVGLLEEAVGPLGLHLEMDRESLPADDPEEASEPPVKLDNPGPATPFELFIRLFNIPRHSELDPTLLVFIFFPLFFGLMIGDFAYGVGYLLLGRWLTKRFPHHAELVPLGRILQLSGLMAALFGLIFYAEAFGMTFPEMAHKLGFELAWPYTPLHKFSSEYVTMMIKVSLLIAGVHLSVGLLAGFRNQLQHHSVAVAATEKLSWIIVIWVLIAGLFWIFKAFTMTFSLGFLLVGLLVGGMAMVLSAEGALGLMEIFNRLSNVLSYTRLLALGLSDAGLALAFNTMALDMVVNPAQPLTYLAALLILLLGHLLIFLLGIIGSGIHALRLQYVEFFPKFFEGGGTPFRPFGYHRQYTTAN